MNKKNGGKQLVDRVLLASVFLSFLHIIFLTFAIETIPLPPIIDNQAHKHI